MKKLVSLLLLSTLLVTFLSGCNKKEYANGQVYVFNWGEYIDEEVIDMFEKKYDIEVVYKTFNDNESMYATIASGAVSYDVICPSDYMIDKMIEEDMLAEINFDNVPNISNIDPARLEEATEFDPGNKYSVPYTWGTLGILYNTTMVDEPIDSWSTIFDEKYKDNILMMDSVRDAYAIALTYLGYSINTTDDAELKEATELLKSQYPIVQAYVVDQVRDKMIAGEAAIGVIYSGEAIYTHRENEDLAYVVPKEGSNVWMDSWVIPKDAKNKENAEKWINFMCEAEIAYKNFDYITYSTPNAAAIELIEDEEIKNSEIAFPSADILSRCTTFSYLGKELEQKYIDLWNTVKNQ